MTAVAADDDTAAPSTVAPALRRLRVALVAGSLVVGALCLLVFGEAHGTVDTIANRAAPAVLQGRAAYGALVDAEQQAAGSIETGTAVLGGSGDQYQNDIAAADQSLAQLTADNVAGADGADQLQLIEGLVVTYNAEVEQADTDMEQSTNTVPTPLAAADLSYARTTVLSTLSDLRSLTSDENAELSALRSSGWLTAAADLAWLLPFLVLLALFWVTTVLVHRRFRRWLSIRVALAVLSLVAMALLCGLSLWTSGDDLDAALAGPFTSAVTASDQQASAVLGYGEAELSVVVAGVCPGGGTCGTGLAKAAPPSPALLDQITNATGQSQRSSQTAYEGGVATADAAYVVRALLIALLAAAAATLTAFGLRPRIDEYKFEA